MDCGPRLSPPYGSPTVLCRSKKEYQRCCIGEQQTPEVRLWMGSNVLAAGYQEDAVWWCGEGSR